MYCTDLLLITLRCHVILYYNVSEYSNSSQIPIWSFNNYNIIMEDIKKNKVCNQSMYLV